MDVVKIVTRTVEFSEVELAGLVRHGLVASMGDE